MNRGLARVLAETEGWRFVAFTRLVPLFPFNLLNYVLGLTRIPLVQYALASALFMRPGALALQGGRGHRVPDGRRRGLRQGRPEAAAGLLQPRLMVKAVARKGEVLLCGTCMDARGLTEAEIVEGARRSTMDEVAEHTIAADRVLAF